MASPFCCPLVAGQYLVVLPSRGLHPPADAMHASYLSSTDPHFNLLLYRLMGVTTASVLSSLQSFLKLALFLLFCICTLSSLYSISPGIGLCAGAGELRVKQDERLVIGVLTPHTRRTDRLSEFQIVVGPAQL